MLIEEFEKIGARVHIATDDGLEGFKGNVLELLKTIMQLGILYTVVALNQC